MLRVKLLTYGNTYVTSVLVFPVQPMPEAIAWGGRTFFRRADGHYVEGLLVPAWTFEELEKQGRAVRADAIQDYVDSEDLAKPES